MVSVIKPNWPAPDNVQAYTSTRQGGFSEAPYDGFNMGVKTGDDPKVVAKNRTLLQSKLQLPKAPLWLIQTHSTDVIDIGKVRRKEASADASYCRRNNSVCCVLTADCLPILICNRQGTCIAAVHAGWRGLAEGVIEATLEELSLDPEDTLVWLGPAIGPTAFEVGSDVYHTFLAQDAQAKKAFKPLSNDKWLADIYHLARLRLYKYHINHIYGGDYCTYTDSEKFYSHRRDGKASGRMASIIWLTS